MNAAKLCFDRSSLPSTPLGDAIPIRKKKKNLKVLLGLILASSGFSAYAQCDAPSDATGDFSAWGILIGSNVTNPTNARDGNLNTKTTFWQGFGAGVLSTHTLTVEMDGNGHATDQLYVKAEMNGSLISANIFSNLVVKYYFTDGTTTTQNLGGALASWGLTIGGASTNNGIYLDPTGKQFTKVDVVFTCPAAVSIAGELANVYEVRRVPAIPAAPVVNGSGTTATACAPAPAIYTVAAPSSNLTYKWYDAATGGALLATGTTYSPPAALPVGPHTVYVEAVAANSCSFPSSRASVRSAATVTITSCLRIAAKAFLRGAFEGNRHKDVTTDWANILKAKALNQPYNTPAFGNYAGTETVPAAIFTATAADNDVVDWVLLELKQANGTLVDRRAALILENGDIVNTDKVSPVSFNASPGSYHLTVRHRNHLGLSSGLLTLTGGNNTFDFTAATDAMLFGDAAAFLTMNGKTLLIGGNANGNGNVRFNGPGNDRDAVLSFLNGNESGMTENVYVPQDLNLDGTVRYNGPGNERDFLIQLFNANEQGFFQQQIR